MSSPSAQSPSRSGPQGSVPDAGSAVPPAALVAAVSRSPAAVAAHDRTAWLDLFARGAEVADPVGSAPVRGRPALTAFYETFIAPNDITFHVDHDVVCGRTVFRDLTLETVMGGRTGPGGDIAAGDVALRVPMHLRYDVADPSGTGREEDLRLALLHAHWELPSQVSQLIAHGGAGARVGAALVPALLRNQGVRGSIGYAEAFRRAGKRGKRTAGAFLDALAAGWAASAESFLAPTARVELPARGTVRTASEFAAFARAGHTLAWWKPVSAGMTVTATIELDGERGVALLEFGGDRERITRARLFLPG